MKRKRVTSCILATAILLMVAMLCTLPAMGQETRGTIRGTIVDASSAVVADATVTITDIAKGTAVKAKTNSAGLYVVPYLLAGSYTVTVEGQGFKGVRQQIELQVGQIRQVDFKLEVGAATETITVTEAAPMLDTATASVGSVVDAKRLAELPIAHGDPYKLMGLATGASWARDPRLDRPFEPTHITGYAIDGTRANRSDLTIDGAPSTATANRGEVTATFVPMQDLVQEFKVQTATYDAASGNTEGAVTALQIKSGTKDLHGTIGYTSMRPSLFANDLIAKTKGQPRADFYYHRYGGTIGGPVYIPKLYEQRKKTFFIFGYEGIQEARPRNNGRTATPTLCMLGRASCNGVQQLGNFSELLALPKPQDYQIYNPFNPVGTTAAFQRTPFANNIIDPNLINPIARKLVDTYWPAPTSAGKEDGTLNFQQPNMTEHAVYNTYTARVDHSINDAHKIFGRVSWYRRTSDYNNYFHNLATGNEFSFVSRQGIFDYVWVANSTTILNTHYAYNRFIRGDAGNSDALGFDLTSVGFPQAYADAISKDVVSFPRIRFGGNVYQETSMNGENRPNDTHAIAATLTKIVGTHSLRTGFEFRAYRENDRFFANNQTGDFLFDNTYTQKRNEKGTANVGNSQQLGHAFAAFLLGLPSTGSVTIPASYAEQSTAWGLFLQDDWKATSKLTLNIGLRWEYEGALTERFNRSVRQLDLGFVQPIETAAKAAYLASGGTPEIPASQFAVRGGLTFAGVGGNPRGLYETPKTDFMPRFGLAYAFDQKTVLRAGYGIFFGFLGQRQGDVVTHGFTANTNMSVSTDGGFSFVNTLSNPFGSLNNQLVQPRGAADGGTTFLGQGITVFNPNPKPSYMQRWSLDIQRELPGGFVADIGYVGNRGTHLEVFSGQSSTTSPNINVTPQKYLSKSPTRDNATRDYLVARIANPFSGLMPSTAANDLRGTTTPRERLLRPFPQFDTVRQDRYDGYSWYHGFQASVNKQLKKGYMINASYTWSKFMTANELLNDDDAKPWEGISDMDFTHRFTTSWIWELPFGRGRALATGATGFLNKVIGDWQMGGYYQFQSGNPLGGWGNLIYKGNLKDITKPHGERTLDSWFNTDGFERGSSAQLDHNVRTFPLRMSWVRSDWINNWDMILLKNISVNEKAKFQFKAEFLNALNHPWMPTPDLGVTNGTFGGSTASNQRNYPRRVQLGLKFLF